MTIIDVVHGDITTMRVDAIVNAANPSLLGGGGVDGAIHRVGGPAILDECRMVRATTRPGGLDVGAVVATTAGRLSATWVVHAVGPHWSRHENNRAVLEMTYRRALLLAHSLGAQSVAFPLISAGSYGWPVADAVDAQVQAVEDAPISVDMVTLVAYTHGVASMTPSASGPRAQLTRPNCSVREMQVERVGDTRAAVRWGGFPTP